MERVNIFVTDKELRYT